MAERATPPLTVKLSVALSDGSFESHVSVPVYASEADKQTAVLRWMDIIQFGLKLPGRVDIHQSADRS